jgi:hypothetical protein
VAALDVLISARRDDWSRGSRCVSSGDDLGHRHALRQLVRRAADGVWRHLPNRRSDDRRGGSVAIQPYAVWHPAFREWPSGTDRSDPAGLLSGMPVEHVGPFGGREFRGVRLPPAHVLGDCRGPALADANQIRKSLRTPMAVPTRSTLHDADLRPWWEMLVGVLAVGVLLAGGWLTWVLLT